MHVVSGLPNDGGGPSIVIPLTVLSENKQCGISSLLLCLYSKHPATGYEYPVSDLIEKGLVYFLRSFAYFRFSPSLISILLFAKYDALHIHGSWHTSTFLSAFICLLRRKRYIITPHGSLVQGHLIKNRFIKLAWWYLVEKYVYMFAHSVRLLSNLELEEIPNFISRNFSNVKFIPNGIDFSLVSSQEALEIKKKNHSVRSVSGEIKFLFFSRLSTIKGIMELLSAWHIATESDSGFLKDCSLDLIGPIDESLTSEVLDFVHKSKSINYLGQVHGVERFRQLLCHDVFVLPTKGEGLSTALLEAISSYCEIITTPMCNLSDDKLTKNFYYCQPFDSSIYEALLNLYVSFSSGDRPILINQREHVISNYGWDHVAGLLLPLYYD